MSRKQIEAFVSILCIIVGVGISALRIAFPLGGAGMIVFGIFIVACAAGFALMEQTLTRKASGRKPKPQGKNSCLDDVVKPPVEAVGG